MGGSSLSLIMASARRLSRTSTTLPVASILLLSTNARVERANGVICDMTGTSSSTVSFRVFRLPGSAGGRLRVRRGSLRPGVRLGSTAAAQRHRRSAGRRHITPFFIDCGAHPCLSTPGSRRRTPRRLDDHRRRRGRGRACSCL